MKYHHGNLRENLIEQACIACEDSGWENISLRSLAKALNVSQTAPYRHFETKEELLAEVAAMGFMRLSDSLKKTSKFLDSGLAYCEFALKYQNTYDLMFGTALGSFSVYPKLQLEAEIAFETLRSDLKNHFINLGHTNISEEIIQEKCISVWAFQHGIVGILRKNAIAEDLGVAKEHGAMSAISSLSNNFDDYLSKSINNLLTI